MDASLIAWAGSLSRPVSHFGCASSVTDFAVPALDALVEAGHEIVAVYCQPPRPAGRGKADRKTAVHERAEELGLEVRTPGTLRNADEQARFAVRGLQPPVRSPVRALSPPFWTRLMRARHDLCKRRERGRLPQAVLL